MKLRFTLENRTSAPHLSDSPGEELDRELARQMSEGDRGALVRFVDRHLGYLYKHLQRRLGPGHDTLIEEIVRATFSVAFRRMRPYVYGSTRTPMRLWLLRLAGRELARRRKKLTISSDANAESEELGELREAIVSLPTKEQAAMCMALFDGLPSQEIAGALGARRARAMRLLRKALKRTGSKLALAHAEVI